MCLQQPIFLLPAEIIDAICSASDLDTLKAFSLVSKYFAAFCQKYLHKSLTLWVDDQSYLQNIHQIYFKSLHLLSYPQRMILITKRVEDTNFKSTIDDFDSCEQWIISILILTATSPITTLQFSQLWWFTITPDVWPKITNSFPHLRHLECIKSTLQHRLHQINVYDLIQSFSKLQSIFFSNVDQYGPPSDQDLFKIKRCFNQDHSLVPPIKSTRSRIKMVAIDSHDVESYWVLCQFSYPFLQTLALTTKKLPEDSDDICRRSCLEYLLSTNGGTVEELHIQIVHSCK